jgi:biopolymer transport protein ExbB
VLYDLLDAAFEQIRIGGWVMYPLVITCLWMWYLVIKKIVDMRAFNRGWSPVDECIKNARKADFQCAPWQRMIMDRYLDQKTDDDYTNDSLLDSLRLGHETFINQYLGIISLLATIAPLLGLLGTVGGMIKTFDVIAEFGTGNARALAAGISEALLTTQTGLVVAVPGLFMSAFLIRRSNNLLERMQRFCLRLLSADLDTN